MTHKRSVGEQIKSGLLIASELVGGFLVFILAAVGLERLISAAPTSHFAGPLTAWIEFGLAAVIMFATAERWGGVHTRFLFPSRSLFRRLLHDLSFDGVAVEPNSPFGSCSFGHL
jgi:hypothetical protein